MRGISRTIAVCALALGACSGGDTPAVTPEPSTAPPPPSSVATTEAPPSSAPATTAPPTTATPPASEAADPPTRVLLSATTDAAHVRARYVAELDTEAADLPACHSAHVRHPNATVRARLNGMLDAAANGFAATMAQHIADDDGAEGDWSCNVITATRVVVTLACDGEWYPSYRGATTQRDGMLAHFEIVGDEVRPTTLDAAIVRGPALDAAEAAAFDEVYEGADPDEIYGLGHDDWSVVDAGIGVTGLEVLWADSQDQGRILQGEVPYAAIVDQIRADGPIAHMLRLGDFAPGATTDVDPNAPPTSVAATGPWVIGSRGPLTETAMRWAALPPRLQAAASVYATGDLTQLGARAEVDADTAHELATALHGTLAPAPADATVSTLEVRRANGSVNVRVSPSGSAPWMATIPFGGLAIARVDPSAATAPSWLDVVVAPGIHGMSSARYLDRADCFPDAASVIAALPADVREEAALHATRVLTSVIDAGHAVPAVLFMTHAGTHTYVALRRFTEATCRVGSELGAWTLDGVGADVLVTRTTHTQGETLVLVQTLARTDATTSTELALRRGTASAVWHLDDVAPPSAANEIRAPARVGPSGRGFWPLALVRRGQPIVPYRWDGATLVVDAP